MSSPCFRTLWPHREEAPRRRSLPHLPEEAPCQAHQDLRLPGRLPGGSACTLLHAIEAAVYADRLSVEAVWDRFSSLRAWAAEAAPGNRCAPPAPDGSLASLTHSDARAPSQHSRSVRSASRCRGCPRILSAMFPTHASSLQQHGGNQRDLNGNQYGGPEGRRGAEWAEWVTHADFSSCGGPVAVAMPR